MTGDKCGDLGVGSKLTWDDDEEPTCAKGRVDEVTFPLPICTGEATWEKKGATRLKRSTSQALLIKELKRNTSNYNMHYWRQCSGSLSIK